MFLPGLVCLNRLDPITRLHDQIILFREFDILCQCFLQLLYEFVNLDRRDKVEA